MLFYRHHPGQESIFAFLYYRKVLESSSSTRPCLVILYERIVNRILNIISVMSLFECSQQKMEEFHRKFEVFIIMTQITIIGFVTFSLLR